MGKSIPQVRGEVENCAGLCDWYTANRAAMLADERLPSMTTVQQPWWAADRPGPCGDAVELPDLADAARGGADPACR